MTDEQDEPSRRRGSRALVHAAVHGAIRKGTPFVAGILAVLVALVLHDALVPVAPQLTQRDVNASVVQALASATPRPPLSEQAYLAVAPSLVLVEAGAPSSSSSTNGLLGSGVVIDTSGDILTSLHVVANASSIEVTFADGARSAAQVETRQPADDIAVLRASDLPTDIVPATLGNPGSVRIGSEAYVVGNPLGLYGSLSAGVVSGLDRSFEMPGTHQVIQGMIQIDAAVNPGNSGGPLLDRAGQVIGIVTGLVNPTGQDAFSGIGFAVPINTAAGAAGLPQY